LTLLPSDRRDLVCSLRYHTLQSQTLPMEPIRQCQHYFIRVAFEKGSRIQGFGTFLPGSASQRSPNSVTYTWSDTWDGSSSQPAKRRFLDFATEALKEAKAHLNCPLLAGVEADTADKIHLDEYIFGVSLDEWISLLRVSICFIEAAEFESRRSRRQFQKKVSNAVFTSRKENYSSCLNIISVADVMIVVQLCKIVEKVGDPSFRGQPLNYLLDEYKNKLEKNQKITFHSSQSKERKEWKAILSFSAKSQNFNNSPVPQSRTLKAKLPREHGGGAIQRTHRDSSI
uniref:Cortactin-binding protein 2 n=1 Tax=Heligmosomoides polygyrus TaxID=6339 RepID=A0A183GUP1_HELPZ